MQQSNETNTSNKKFILLTIFRILILILLVIGITVGIYFLAKPYFPRAVYPGPTVDNPTPLICQILFF